MNRSLGPRENLSLTGGIVRAAVTLGLCVSVAVHALADAPDDLSQVTLSAGDSVVVHHFEVPKGIAISLSLGASDRGVLCDHRWRKVSPTRILRPFPTSRSGGTLPVSLMPDTAPKLTTVNILAQFGFADTFSVTTRASLGPQAEPHTLFSLLSALPSEELPPFGVESSEDRSERQEALFEWLLSARARGALFHDVAPIRARSGQMGGIAFYRASNPTPLREYLTGQSSSRPRYGVFILPTVVTDDRRASLSLMSLQEWESRFGAAEPGFIGRLDEFLPGDPYGASLLDPVLRAAQLTCLQRVSDLTAVIAPRGSTVSDALFEIGSEDGTLSVVPSNSAGTAVSSPFQGTVTLLISRGRTSQLYHGMATVGSEQLDLDAPALCGDWCRPLHRARISVRRLSIHPMRSRFQVRSSVGSTIPYAFVRIQSLGGVHAVANTSAEGWATISHSRRSQERFMKIRYPGHRPYRRRLP